MAALRKSVEPEAPFDQRFRRWLAAGLEQQMWFLGCDCAAGGEHNLLVEYGFRKFRDPGQSGRSSRYQLHRADASVVDLHGFHAAVLAPGAGAFVYLRGRQQSYATDDVGLFDPGAWTPQRMSSFPRPEAARSTLSAGLAFLQWLLDYEAWVEGKMGPRFRQHCHRRAPLPWLPPARANDWFDALRQRLTRELELPASG